MSYEVRICDVVKKYGDFHAVDGVSLDIRQGEFFTLLGPSGCGKTTLLRMIAGFNKIDQGEIYFGDRLINNISANKRDIGMVFQNYAVFPHMTVSENVAYGLKARKISKPERTPRVLKALEKVQIENLKDRMPDALSGGQQQRVALARALVIRPRVLLMDEPLSNLDAKLRVSMREEIRRIQQSLGITTIYVTHDQEEAMAVSDRIAIFYAGHLQQVASPAAIYFSPANRFTAEFMGSCNILETMCTGFDSESRMATATVGDSTFSFHADDASVGAPLHIMLRPDWIGLAGPDSSNRFNGRIVDRMFLGESIVYQVEALGRALRVDMPSLNRGEMLEPGASVELCFAPESPVTVRA